MTPKRSAILPLLAAVAAAALTGCTQGPRDFENENDRLRRRVLELENEVESLRAERSELRAKLAEAQRTPGGVAPEALEALPRVAGINIDRLSGPDDTDRDGAPDRIVVYVKPYDARQRFLQIAGELAVDAFALPPGAGAEPQRIASITLSPDELRDAYRYDFTGQYYSAAIPLDGARIPEGASVLLRAAFDDAVTGQTHTAERIVGP